MTKNKVWPTTLASSPTVARTAVTIAWFALIPVPSRKRATRAWIKIEITLTLKHAELAVQLVGDISSFQLGQV